MRRLVMENFSSQNVPKAVSAKKGKARVQIEKEMLTKAKHNSIEYLEHDMDMIKLLVKSISSQVGAFTTEKYVEAEEEDEEEIDKELRRQTEKKQANEIAKFENDMMIHEENECFKYIVEIKDDIILDSVVTEVEEEIVRQKEQLVFLFEVEEENERQKVESANIFDVTEEDENEMRNEEKERKRKQLMDYETELYEDVMEYEELKKTYEEENFREYICEEEERSLILFADEIERREEEINEMRQVALNMKHLGDKSKSDDTDFECPEDEAEVIKAEERRIREQEKNHQQAKIKGDEIMHDELMSCEYDFDEADRNLGISTLHHPLHPRIFLHLRNENIGGQPILHQKRTIITFWKGRYY